MTNQMPKYVTRMALLSGVLLLPFTAALILNTIDQLTHHQSLYESWAWRMPILALWVLWLPI
ncbi:hypothetical protein, partial [Klebsiella pneumoniae]|uniref:hypothetical protein n=1 Tax=Klebsiella pneumoniae TaxID=573 RepID=UPI0025A110F3